MRTCILTATVIICCCKQSISQDNQTVVLKRSWQVGLGLGELPIGSSFKPSVTFGYHITDKLYAGVIFQFPDKINRNGTSFNARSTNLEGLVNSGETVAQRFMLQCRYTPIQFGPYLSAGLVFNGRDTELMNFDNRTRIIGGQVHDGSLSITQTRPAGWGFACGIGYQYNFSNGFSVNAEWTPAWMQYPVPTYTISSSTELPKSAINNIKKNMDNGFKSSPTNMYKVFHVGFSYRLTQE